MAKKVSMQQIADYCGVSKFVVSKALSGKGGVSETTKDKVIQAASQLGYFTQKNNHIKPVKTDQLPAFVGGMKQSVLVLMPNIRFQTMNSAYWGKIINGISLELEEEGLGVIMISEQSVDNFQHVFNPNGILGMIGVGEISTSLLLEVHRIGLPMVLVDHEDPLIPTDSVFVNNYDCMMRLTKHLIGIGHRHLVFFANPRYSRSFNDRWSGFRCALEEYNLYPSPQRELLLNLEGIEDFQDQIRVWLSKKRPKGLPTAILCGNDKIAKDTMQVFKEHGVAVPQDVSVAGFDNIEGAGEWEPNLSTVNVPKEALGKRAVKRLLSRIHDRQSPTEKILISGDILYRNSIAEVKGSKLE